MPVGGLPDRHDGGQLGFFLADIGFEPQFVAVRQAAQMINHRPARVVAVIVHAADIHQVVKTQLIFGEFADLGDAPGVAEVEGDFAAKFRRLGDDRAEFGF